MMMEAIDKLKFESKDKLYGYMNLKLKGLLATERDWLANLSNTAALFWMLVDDINWAGFYLYKDGELVLGPFQGKPACTRIAVGKGVCGTAAAVRKTQLVPDVHKFPGHIACDSDSRSEIVVPVVKDNRLIGVFDVDSPKLSRFDEDDKKYIESFVGIMIAYMEFPEKFIW